MKAILFRLRPVLAAISVSVLAACSSTPREEARWVDLSVASRPGVLRGQKVLVACNAYDAAVRQLCQDALYREVLAKGGNPVVLPPGASFMTDRDLDGQLVASAGALDANAVFVMTLTPIATNAGSGLSLGIGGFSFGRGGGAGIGLSAPLGGSQPGLELAANGRVTEVSTSRLIWTASFLSSGSQSLEEQATSLSRSMLDAAKSSGIF